jgi:hypothetical protein
MCENCIHCIDKKYWTCEYEEPCINGSLYESEPKEKFNEIET